MKLDSKDKKILIGGAVLLALIIISVFMAPASAYSQADYQSLVSDVQAHIAEKPKRASRWGKVLLTLSGEDGGMNLARILRKAEKRGADSMWGRVAAYLQWKQGQTDLFVNSEIIDPPQEVQILEPQVSYSTQLPRQRQVGGQDGPAWRRQAPDISLFDTEAPGSFTVTVTETCPRNNPGCNPRNYPGGVQYTDHALGGATYDGPVTGTFTSGYAHLSHPRVNLTLNDNATRMDAVVSAGNHNTNQREDLEIWNDISLATSQFTAENDAVTLAGNGPVIFGQFYNDGEAVFGGFNLVEEFVEGTGTTTFAACGEDSTLAACQGETFNRWRDAAVAINEPGTMPNWLRSPDDYNDDTYIKGWGPWADLPANLRTTLSNYDLTFATYVQSTSQLDTEAPGSFTTTVTETCPRNDRNCNPLNYPGGVQYTTVDLGGATYEGAVVGTIHPNVAHDGNTRPYGYKDARIHFELDLDAVTMDAAISYAYHNPGDDPNGDPRRSRFDIWYNIDISGPRFENDGLIGQFYGDGASIYGVVQRPKIIGRYHATKQ